MRKLTNVVIAAALLLPACEATSHGASTDPAPAVISAPAAEDVFPGSTLSTVPDVAERVVQSVVNISVSHKVTATSSPFGNDPFFRHFFGPNTPPQEGYENGMGSGVVVTTDGVVLTNNHVVDHADEIDVRLHDGRILRGEVVGTDPQTDVAVVRLKDPPDDLVPLPMASGQPLRLGETVLAVGNPLGIGQTVTMGIVSATGRAGLGITDYEDFIQTDAAINPGNSGGALVNLKGELVGINTAIMSRDGGYQGIGLAIPVSLAKGVMDQLLENGTVDRGYLGVAIQDLDPQLREGLGIDVEAGVLVGDVVPDSPAAKAGFERGDVVLTFNGAPTTTAKDLRLMVAGAGPDATFQAEVIRDGRNKALHGTLGRLDEQVAGVGTSNATEEGPLEGLTVAPLDQSAREQLDLPDRVEGGVLVRGVVPGSPAARMGLRPGDVVLEANRAAVGSVEELNQALAHGGGRTLLLVWRDGTTLFLAAQG